MKLAEMNVHEHTWSCCYCQFRKQTEDNSAPRAYSVMVTSHLAMVEFRVRFPIGALRDRSSKFFGYTMIIKNQSKPVQTRQLYLDYASLV